MNDERDLEPSPAEDEPRPPRGPSPGEGARGEDRRQEGEPPEAAGERPPSYVFKIVSADPKNSLSFEDVADK